MIYSCYGIFFFHRFSRHINVEKGPFSIFRRKMCSGGEHVNTFHRYFISQSRKIRAQTMERQEPRIKLSFQLLIYISDLSTISGDSIAPLEHVIVKGISEIPRRTSTHCT